MMSTLKVSKERLINLLVAPHVSEKSARAAAANQYVFKVLTDATKPEIKAAVEMLFSKKDTALEVTGVRVANVKGKEKRFGRFIGRRRNWKKAYVSLAAGQEINFQATE